MQGLGALAHYHERNRALGPPLWGAIGIFWGSDLWARGRGGECPGWALGSCPGRRHRAGDEEWLLKTPPGKERGTLRSRGS